MEQTIQRKYRERQITYRGLTFLSVLRTAPHSLTESYYPRPVASSYPSQPAVGNLHRLCIHLWETHWRGVPWQGIELWQIFRQSNPHGAFYVRRKPALWIVWVRWQMEKMTTVSEKGGHSIVIWAHSFDVGVAVPPEPDSFCAFSFLQTTEVELEVFVIEIYWSDSWKIGVEGLSGGCARTVK